MHDFAQLADRLVARFELTGTQMLETGIPDLKLLHQVSPVARSPLVFNSGIFITLKGRKLIYMSGRSLHYDAGTYIAVGLPLAMECETIASPEEPLIAFYVNVDLVVLRSLASAIGGVPEVSDSLPIHTAPICSQMNDLIGRLVACLESPEDTAALGKGLVREVIYRALTGPAGPALHGLLNGDSQTARIALIMQTLNARLSERFSVEDMAQLAGMSASSFHRAFREVTDDTPLQYLKKVRLSRASTLMASENYRVSTAAAAVGYESAAQFSRDFKSHFGLPPGDVRKLGYAMFRTGLGNS